MADTEDSNVQNEETLIAQDDDRPSRLTQFPQTRIRNMMKIDPDLHLANREAVFLLTRAALPRQDSDLSAFAHFFTWFLVKELFVEHIAKEAYKRTVVGKRKTIQRKDLDTTIEENEEMAFLEGTLE